MTLITLAKKEYSKNSRPIKKYQEKYPKNFLENRKTRQQIPKKKKFMIFLTTF